MAALETDGAMIEYRKEAVRNPDGLDPAEWIAALHEEHFRTLKLLNESEGERVARIFAGLQLVIREAKRAETELGLRRTDLGNVLGDTPAVQSLRNVARDLRVSVIQSLEAMIQEGRQ